MAMTLRRWRRLDVYSAIGDQQGIIGRLITAAGQFALTWLSGVEGDGPIARGPETTPRFTEGEVNGRRIMLDLNEPVDAKLHVFSAFDARGLKLMCSL